MRPHVGPSTEYVFFNGSTRPVFDPILTRVWLDRRMCVTCLVGRWSALWEGTGWLTLYLDHYFDHIERGPRVLKLSRTLLLQTLDLIQFGGSNGHFPHLFKMLKHHFKLYRPSISSELTSGKAKKFILGKNLMSDFLFLCP